MSEDRAPRGRTRWLLIGCAAVLLSPAPLAVGLLAAAGIAVFGSVLVGAAQRRAERRRATQRAGVATVLGADGDGRILALDDHQLSAHALILGASGAGKSTTLLAILTDHIARGHPVVAIDLKGSPAFARRLAGAAAQAGREFRLWSPDGPGHWNPLEHGNATELKDKLIATERFTEPHYQRAAERYVQTALQVLLEVDLPRRPTLEQVVEAMDPHRLAILLRGLGPQRAHRVQDYLATMTPDQLSAVRGLGTRLAIITESDTGRFLRSGPGPAVDLRRALAGEEVVLFSLNSSTYGKFAAQLGTLAVQDLVAAVGHGLATEEGASRSPAMVGLDEFSALGADNVVALLARGREAGVSVLLATQELADLDRAAPGLRDQVLGNTALKIAHRQDVPGSAQTIAQMAGTVKRWEETRQVGGTLLGSYDRGRGTRRMVDGFVVHPNEIKALGTGEAVVIVKQPQASVRKVRVRPPPDRGPELG